MSRWQKTFFRQLLPFRAVALAQASSPSSLLSRRQGCYYGSALEGRNGKSAPLQARGMVDKFRMRAKGSDGGNGCVSLRRSRSNLHDMPDGGNGGKGGDVILECSRSIWDFSGLQHHMRGDRGGNGVSKNQIGTRGSDKIARVPVGTVIHLVNGEQPSLTVNKPTRTLDPWDIPVSAEHSSGSNQIDNAVMKYFDGGLSHRHIAPEHNTDSDARSFPCQEGIDEKDQTESEGDEFWEDEDEFNIDNEDDKEEEEREKDVQYCVAEMTKPGQQLIIARGGEGELRNAFVIKEMRPSKANRQEKIARVSTGQPGTESFTKDWKVG